MDLSSAPAVLPETRSTSTVPSVTSVILTSLDIMQARLSRSRLAGDPPDVLIAPRVRQLPPLEFAGGRATIEAGCAIVREMMPTLNAILGLDRTS